MPTHFSAHQTAQKSELACRKIIYCVIFCTPSQEGISIINYFSACQFTFLHPLVPKDQRLLGADGLLKSVQSN